MKVQSIRAQAEELKIDLRSKLVDGVMAAVILCLLTVLLSLLVWPFEQVFGSPGHLIYAIAILAISIFCLERSLVRNNSETRRAWYGITGGITGWMVMALINTIGTVRLASPASLLTLMMVSLIIATLWRRGLPLGAQFYSQAFMMSWMSRLGVVGLAAAADWSPVFQVALPIVGWMGVLGALTAVLWLFGRSEWRMQRLWCALWIWFFLSVALLAFTRGGF